MNAISPCLTMSMKWRVIAFINNSQNSIVYTHCRSALYCAQWNLLSIMRSPIVHSRWINWVVYSAHGDHSQLIFFDNHVMYKLIHSSFFGEPRTSGPGLAWADHCQVDTLGGSTFRSVFRLLAIWSDNLLRCVFYFGPSLAGIYPWPWVMCIYVDFCLFEIYIW